MACISSWRRNPPTVRPGCKMWQLPSNHRYGLEVAIGSSVGIKVTTPTTTQNSSSWPLPGRYKSTLVGLRGQIYTYFHALVKVPVTYCARAPTVRWALVISTQADSDPEGPKPHCMASAWLNLNPWPIASRTASYHLRKSYKLLNTSHSDNCYISV